VGHELGNGKYILSRKPDLIVFHNSLGDVHPTWRGGREMMEIAEFSALYQLVTFDAGGGVQTRMWVRKEDGKLGTKRGNGEVVIPGYLLYPWNGGVAALDAEGHMAERIDGEHSASIHDVRLEPGRWQLTVEGLGAFNTLVFDPPRGKVECAGNAPCALGPCEPGRPLTVIVRARRERAYVRRLVFRRDA